MNVKRDGHIHSPYCPHGTKDSFEMYVEKALEKGLEEITFTEHMPFTSVFLENKDFQDECAMDIKDIDSYINDVKEIKKKYEGKIKINLGFEVDYIEGLDEEIKENILNFATSFQEIDGIYLIPEHIETYKRVRDEKYLFELMKFIDKLRENGIKAGLLKVRVFRPFPVDEIAEALGNAKAIAVLDRADSLNGAGGALFTDVASAMYVNKKQVPAVSYIYGIGGRDTTETEIASVYTDLQEIVKSGKVENPYRYLGLKEEK